MLASVSTTCFTSSCLYTWKFYVFMDVWGRGWAVCFKVRYRVCSCFKVAIICFKIAVDLFNHQANINSHGTHDAGCLFCSDGCSTCRSWVGSCSGLSAWGSDLFAQANDVWAIRPTQAISLLTVIELFLMCSSRSFIDFFAVAGVGKSEAVISYTRYIVILSYLVYR